MSKKLLFFAAVCILLIFAAGCSQKDSTVMLDSEEPVELYMFYPWVADWPQEVFQETFADPIQEKFPHITIHYVHGTNVAEMLTAGQQIDIMWQSTGVTPRFLLAYEMQYDITEFIEKYDYDLDRFDPAIIEAGRQVADGGLYGLPIYVPPSTVYYNKDIFDKFGVDYPKDGMTWDEMYDLNQKLTRSEDGTQYVGIASSYGHLTLLNQKSIPLVDKETNQVTFYTDDRWKPWIENLVRFYDNYDTPYDQLSEPRERTRFFKDRTIAMFLAMTALEPQENMEGMNWDLTTFPSFSDQKGVGPQPYPNYFYVTSMSEHKEAAFQAITYLGSDEYQRKWSEEGILLTTLDNKKIREDFGKNNPFYTGKNVKALWPKQYAQASEFSEYNNIAYGQLNTAIRKINDGQLDINSALREAAELSNQKIDEQLKAKE